MGYFSEMSLDMQESRKPSAAPLTRERAFEEGESFDELRRYRRPAVSLYRLPQSRRRSLLLRTMKI